MITWNTDEVETQLVPSIPTVGTRLIVRYGKGSLDSTRLERFFVNSENVIGFKSPEMTDGGLPRDRNLQMHQLGFVSMATLLWLGQDSIQDDYTLQGLSHSSTTKAIQRGWQGCAHYGRLI